MEQVNIVGFDRSSRSWVTKASDQPAVRLPKLDGALLIDEASLNEAANDFGHLRNLRPIAVLEPTSHEDVIKMVGFANEHGIKIAARGRGHSAFGQSGVEGGILIRTNTLDIPPVFTDDAVQVSSGMTWINVLAATLKHGLRPPVITQSPELSVGGTLSVGGIDGGSYRYGLQIDNVLELQVVTGDGRLITCSDVEEPDLFNAVLAGLGQCGIILSAKLRLMHAETHARIFRMYYPDLSTLLNDARVIIAEERFDRLQGRVTATSEGGWRYFLVAASNYTPPTTPDNTDLLKGLNFMKESFQVNDSSYFRYADRSWQFAAARASGRFDQPHPWFQILTPDSAIDEFGTEVLGQLTPAEIGEDAPVELFPLKTERCHRPLFRLPDHPLAFGFGCPSTAPDAETAVQMLDRNKRFYERARALGCTLYPIGAMPFTAQDWQEHYHPFWEQFSNAKQRYDSGNVLAPGPGIF
ncbi:MAG: FAD-binding protein [Chloroflexota bacterium]